jgi:hypothetical protein
LPIQQPGTTIPDGKNALTSMGFAGFLSSETARCTSAGADMRVDE